MDQEEAWTLTIGDLVLKRFYNWREVAIVNTPPIRLSYPFVRVPGVMKVFVLSCDDPTGVWRIGGLWVGNTKEVIRRLASVEDILRHRTIENMLRELGRIDLNKLRDWATRHRDVVKERP